jgi:hypothetical protein
MKADIDVIATIRAGISKARNLNFDFNIYGFVFFFWVLKITANVPRLGAVAANLQKKFL